MVRVPKGSLSCYQPFGQHPKIETKCSNRQPFYNKTISFSNGPNPNPNGYFISSDKQPCQAGIEYQKQLKCDSLGQVDRLTEVSSVNANTPGNIKPCMPNTHKPNYYIINTNYTETREWAANELHFAE